MLGEGAGADCEERLSPSMSGNVENDPLAGSVHLARHAERLDRYQQLVQLQEEGFTQKEIARRMGMGERTVRYWLTRGIPYGSPELRRKRRRGFDPYAAYVSEHCNQGVAMVSSFGVSSSSGIQGRFSNRLSVLGCAPGRRCPLRGKAQRSRVLQSLRLSSGPHKKRSGGLSVTRPISRRRAKSTRGHSPSQSNCRHRV